MKYASHKSHQQRSKLYYISIVLVIALTAAFAGSVGYRTWYERQLTPASTVERVEVVEIPSGASVQEIASLLQEKGLIRSSQAMVTYARTNALFNDMKAGTYRIDASKSTPDIVAVITLGKVLENRITILPGSRLDEIQKMLNEAGFKSSDISSALDPGNYKSHPALVAKPTSQSLEGYLFPETFNATSQTTVQDIIEQSLDEMAIALTPERIDAFQRQGLGIHQAVTLASIVLQESSNSVEQKKIAGVFYNRLGVNMSLGADPTYQYIADITGQERSALIDSPYNTRKYTGLPPGPISNVSVTALDAVANPSASEYFYFVAGDDGVIYYAKTLEEHEQNVKNHCVDLCSRY